MSQLSAWAERTENGRIRCTNCGDTSDELPVAHREECIYTNDLVADGGEPAGEVSESSEQNKKEAAICPECENRSARAVKRRQDASGKTIAALECARCGWRAP